MNKAALIDAIHGRLGTNKTTIGAVLDAQAAVIGDHLAGGDAYIEREAVLPGLGKLKTTERAARTGRNPQTGAPVSIPARTGVKFSASKALTDLLNA
ncbi:HU family DNA-binding protein [Thauera butanivorans]|uniref:HU family DNA-binding protein n=1 Tax=Thauera butanivorans TaxID=86174 RepID=UPI000837C45C|nr:HU family DNA-binding protein [Thauera butanivorans]